MYLKGISTVLSLAALILLAGLLAGCGGGGGQAGNEGNGSQGGDSGGQDQQGTEAAKKTGGVERKTALGTIIKVDGEGKRIVLKPSGDEQGDKRLVFTVRKNAKITLDGEKAEVADIQEGQQAQIDYIVAARGEAEVERNRARAIQLFKDGEKPAGGGEQTG